MWYIINRCKKYVKKGAYGVFNLLSISYIRNMNLQDISDVYQKNLMDFFSKEEVVECIYKEQYGEENYKNNKEKYHEEYKKILENTVFIPYVTLEHLQKFITANKDKYGEQYIRHAFNEENKLLQYFQK